MLQTIHKGTKRNKTRKNLAEKEIFVQIFATYKRTTELANFSESLNERNNEQYDYYNVDLLIF